MPVTLISATPNEIVLRRLEDTDGYTAVQLALPVSTKDGTVREDQTKRQKRYVARREFALELDDTVTELTVGQFTPGDIVEVSGQSKGKGFQGVVKRHGFKGGPASHGHRHVLRSPGSIGSAFPQHVMKGKRMAGRMGSDRVTVKNLPIVWVDVDKHLLAIKGAVPGTRGSVVEIRMAQQLPDETQES